MGSKFAHPAARRERIPFFPAGFLKALFTPSARTLFPQVETILPDDLASNTARRLTERFALLDTRYSAAKKIPSSEGWLARRRRSPATTVAGDSGRGARRGGWSGRSHNPPQGLKL